MKTYEEIFVETSMKPAGEQAIQKIKAVLADSSLEDRTRLQQIDAILSAYKQAAGIPRQYSV